MLLSTIGLQTVHSCFDGNYPLNVPLDRTNYLGWLPVHIRGMVELPKNKHPHVYKEFSTSGGKFTVQKMTNTFSSIPLDQAHEQNNELIKRDCEAIGITETPGALLMDGGWTGAGKIGKRV